MWNEPMFLINTNEYKNHQIKVISKYRESTSQLLRKLKFQVTSDKSKRNILKIYSYENWE